MKQLVPLACLTLLACGQSPEPAVTPETLGSDPPPASQAIIPVGSLAGAYRVAGIDDAPLDAPVGLALTVTDNRIIFDAACGGFAWDYTHGTTGLATRRVVSPEADCLARTSFPRVVFDLAAALDAVTTAERTPSNAVVLSSGDRSVTLYSQ